MRLQLEVIRLAQKAFGQRGGLEHDGLSQGPGLLRNGQGGRKHDQGQEHRSGEFQIHGALDVAARVGGNSSTGAKILAVRRDRGGVT